jgi:hypothetical protein
MQAYQACIFFFFLNLQLILTRLIASKYRYK